jgi:hypothetical protein
MIESIGTDGRRTFIPRTYIFPERRIEPIEGTAPINNPRKEQMPYNKKGKRIKPSKETLNIIA